MLKVSQSLVHVGYGFITTFAAFYYNSLLLFLAFLWLFGVYQYYIDTLILKDRLPRYEYLEYSFGTVLGVVAWTLA